MFVHVTQISKYVCQVLVVYKKEEEEINKRHIRVD